MIELIQYSLVRIRQLIHDPEYYDGWGLNQRPPEIGDIGSIVEILNAPGLPVCYIVERCGPDGVTIWLGEFCAEEVETFSIGDKQNG